jgi:hypothetical protein
LLSASWSPPSFCGMGFDGGAGGVVVGGVVGAGVVVGGGGGVVVGVVVGGGGGGGVVVGVVVGGVRGTVVVGEAFGAADFGGVPMPEAVKITAIMAATTAAPMAPTMTLFLFITHSS